MSTPDVIHYRGCSSFVSLSRTYKLWRYGPPQTTRQLKSIPGSTTQINGSPTDFVYERTSPPRTRILIRNYYNVDTTAKSITATATQLMHQYNVEVVFLEHCNNNNKISTFGYTLIKLPYPLLWKSGTLTDRLNSRTRSEINAMAKCLTVGNPIYLPFELRAHIIYFLL